MNDGKRIISQSGLSVVVFYGFFFSTFLQVCIPTVGRLHLGQNFFEMPSFIHAYLALMVIPISLDFLLISLNVKEDNITKYRCISLLIVMSLATVVSYSTFGLNSKMPVYWVFGSIAITIIYSMKIGNLSSFINLIISVLSLFNNMGINDLLMTSFTDERSNLWHALTVTLSPFIISLICNYTAYNMYKRFESHDLKLQNYNLYLKKIVNQDPLTKLDTRASAEVNFKQIIKLTEVNNVYVSVTLLDIDYFKSVNTFYGHLGGDEALKHSAKIISNITPMVFRLGGDEFIILASHASEESFQRFSSQIDSICQYYQKVNYHDEVIEFKFSAGTFLINNPISFQTALRECDLGLRTSKLKKEQKHSIQINYDLISENLDAKLDAVYGPPTTKIIDGAKINAEIQKSILEKEFTYYLQPIVDLNLKKVIGAEGLLRWEKNGEIYRPLKHYLDRFKIIEPKSPYFEAISETRKTLQKTLRSQITSRCDLHFNMNSNFFQSSRTSSGVYDLCDKMFGYDNNIVIEITEEVLTIEKEGALSAFLERAKELGFKIALDDFVSDHSNLNRLIHHDIDIIKLDKGIVQNIVEFQKAKLIVKHLKKMCDDLNIEIYAEGVSSKAISDSLLEMGISIHQGFFYSKPVSVSQFLDTSSDVWKEVVDR